MSYNRNFFDSLEGGGSGDDWNIDELDEIQRMLESDGSDMPLPEEQSAESPEKPLSESMPALRRPRAATKPPSRASSPRRTGSPSSRRRPRPERA